jgi:hypothetical protein
LRKKNLWFIKEGGSTAAHATLSIYLSYTRKFQEGWDAQHSAVWVRVQERCRKVGMGGGGTVEGVDDVGVLDLPDAALVPVGVALALLFRAQHALRGGEADAVRIGRAVRQCLALHLVSGANDGLSAVRAASENGAAMNLDRAFVASTNEALHLLGFRV